MALTYSFLGVDQVKGPYQGSPAATPMHVMRFTLGLTGTYATNGDQLDFCKFFSPSFTTGSSPKGVRGGVTAIKVLWVKAFGDFYDGTTTASVKNSAVSLSSGGTATAISAASTNNLVTLVLSSDDVNGEGTGTEVTNTTSMTGSYTVLAGVQLTYGSTNGVG